MTDLDAIPADVTMPMTEPLQRAFRMAECDPACHVCGDQIDIGDDFILATIRHVHPRWDDEEFTDEMVCGKHTRKDLEVLSKEQTDEEQRIVDLPPHKGFSRPSIVGAVK